MYLPTAIHGSTDLAALLNNSTPATEEDAAETPRDWLAGLWVGGQTYPLDPDATTETLAVLADGTAAVRWYEGADWRSGRYCGHHNGADGRRAHWCVADTDAWTEKEDARGVIRDWRSVNVWDANGYSDTTTYDTVTEAEAAFDREVDDLKTTAEQLAD